MLQLYQKYIDRHNPLAHHLHHFLWASTGLYFAYLAYDSITAWEVLLYYLTTYMLFMDDFLYTIVHYLTQPTCRHIVNYFLIGDVVTWLRTLHEKRLVFHRLIIHNIAVYGALWWLWYATIAFEYPLFFYALSGVQVHLLFDMLNDYYEFGTVKRFLWPIESIM